MRVDLLLVKKNLADSRTKAQEMIKNGQVSVLVNGQKKIISKVSEDMPETTDLYIESGFATEFVSRAGHKIKGAADVLNLNFNNKICLDVGVSTGGFSDFLLQSGAKQVVGIDVGQDQTHPKIKKDSRFVLFEKINARYLEEQKSFQDIVPASGFDFICMDVSFISVRLILPQLYSILKENGDLLVLIKPQFELGPDALNEKGIVKDSKQYIELEQTMIAMAVQNHFKVNRYFPSSIEGKDGNKEFFLFLGKNRD